MKRRAFTIRAASYAAVASLLLTPCMGRAQETYDGPIIDAHDHLGGSFDWETMVKAMNRNHVTRRSIMARYYPGLAGPNNAPGIDDPGTDEDALRLAERYPGRFFPLVGMQQPLLTGAAKWQSPDRAVEGLIQATEAKLASGRFYGIGEFIVRHWSYDNPPGLHSEQNNPIYSTFMKRMSAIAARFDVPMVIHMEGYPSLVDDLSRLLAEYPNTRMVWAHNCGRSKATVIHAMLARHPNLFCDLGNMTSVAGYGTGWPRSEEFTAFIEKDGVLFPDMRALFDDFPDRFMLGMDVAHARANRMGRYSGVANRFRVLLAQLKPQTAQMIARTNAIRVFKLDSHGR